MHDNLSSSIKIRYDWSVEEVRSLFSLPFPELIFQAQTVHRSVFDPTKIQISSLLSIKTGGCPEDCAYCPQSVSHQEHSLGTEKLLTIEYVLNEAKKAKAAGATRFCMGAAWRSPKEHEIDIVCTMIEGVKKLGLETCVTLGMLNEQQAVKLRNAGLDYYNHNLDTSANYYSQIITTRTYQDRLDTLSHVRNAGIRICCGGIIGMGESETDRASLITTLATLPQHPESVPINLLVRVEGTPLAKVDMFDPLEFVRMVAVSRITMPRSYVRLAAGRKEMSDEAQALCFLAGANSIFYGENLLTTPNAHMIHDRSLLEKLGMHSMTPDDCSQDS